MEKTVTINISGWVFNINENAYDKLTEYFVKLKDYFRQQEDGDEIVMDIEGRIAELFKEQNKDKESVIDLHDVEKVMSIMGQPYEMEEDFEEEPPVEKKSPWSKNKKKLFRDPIHAHIGGVAAGLGTYINIDPIFVRILFIATSFTGGVGVMAYAILWMLIPEAKSTSNRIEMEGKKVTVQNIEEKVREEAAYIGKRLNDFSEEAKDVYLKTGPVRKVGLQKAESIIKAIGRFLLRVLKIILGIVLFSTGATALVFFAIFYFNWFPSLDFDTFFVSGISLPTFLYQYVFEGSYKVATLIAISFTLFIPIVLFVMGGIRLIFNLKRNKLVSQIAWQAWIVALILSLGLSYNTIKSFKTDSTQITSYPFEQLQSDTLYINLNTLGYYGNVKSKNGQEIIGQDIDFPIERIAFFYGIPDLEFVTTKDQEFEMKLYLEASGLGEESANNNLERIEYIFHMDSTSLLLDPYFGLKNNMDWRNQEVKIKLFIPEGKSIAIDKNIKRHFDMPYSIRKQLRQQKEDYSYWTNKQNSIELMKKEKMVLAQ
ncbi:MAG: hypothetical protein B7C24_15995 [Bacteroidetes bacterium 4572_77]|nr:MAG: hypothetical protein B7C24_15995 [Bacteroidetes bacterium 4572_77]